MILIMLILQMVLWTGIDAEHKASLEVSCNKVALKYGGTPTSNKRIVEFQIYDERFDRMWTYHMPMRVGEIGEILLEPTEYWTERIKNENNITLKVENIEYNFDLRGSYKAIEC